jgi:AraC family transcriptional regulator, transcriptional activator of the genes for pyochelin and ferripyochelin receptors
MISNQVILNFANIPVLTFKEKEGQFGSFTPVTDEDPYLMDRSLSSVSIRDMYLPNFSLRILEGQFSRDVTFFNKNGDGVDLPGSCLFLQGNWRSTLPGMTHALEGRHGTQNFKYDPNNEFRHKMQRDEYFRLLHISYTTDHLFSFLPQNERWALALKRRIENRERVYGDDAVHIAPAQNRALQTIFNNPLRGSLGNMMLETAVAQIILLQLDGLFKTCPSRNTSLRSRDKKTIYDVKDYLAASFLDDHSLQSLSQLFGVNTNKLMGLFKNTFGKSIFEFIMEQRMQHAHTLLEDTDDSVNEIARTVGYKNPNHFSAAFKREFGISPSQVRQVQHRHFA